DLTTAVEEFESRLIDEALRRSKGNKQAAARLLGLKRTTLVAKLRRRRGPDAPADPDLDTDVDVDTETTTETEVTE
ncbi:MAG: helix-turn-helix domain-containing protein, partial [Candidatus Binatia bacterium]